METNPCSGYLNTIVNSSIEPIAINAMNKEITIVNEVNKECKVFTDNNMTKTVIRNLVTNSVKFTNNGGFVHISAQERGPQIEVKVMDSGIGMPDDIKNNLFQIDKKTGRSGTNGEPSTGLGLILCKELIDKLDGEFKVESAPRQGTTVIFTLTNSDD